MANYKISSPPSGNVENSYEWKNWFNRLASSLTRVLITYTTATTATSGANTLPASPAGFIVTRLPNGTEVKVPYYNS